MIYLFNSGFRNLYRTNVLNTLSLPAGAVNEYRYRHRGQRVQIEQRRAERFLASQRGADVAIVFIDRYNAGAYRYFPMRLGNLASSPREDGDQLFFPVQLFDYAWPHEPTAISARLLTLLQPHGIPSLKGNDPSRTDDGYYAIEADSLFEDLGLYEQGVRGWEGAAKAFSAMQAFSVQDEHVLFTKLAIVDKSLKEQTSTLDKHGTAVFTLSKGDTYGVEIRYLYPQQHVDQSAELKLSINPGEGLQVLGAPSIRIDSYFNTVSRKISVKRFSDAAETAITFEVQHPQNAKTLSADRALQVRLKESVRFWMLTVAAILLFALGSITGGMDFQGRAIDLEGILAKLTWLRLLSAVVQAGVLVYFARFFGKKVL